MRVIHWPMLTLEDRLLMRELYFPTDGEPALTGREIAEKFGVPMHVVYNTVHLTPEKIRAMFGSEKTSDRRGMESVVDS